MNGNISVFIIPRLPKERCILNVSRLWPFVLLLRATLDEEEY